MTTHLSKTLNNYAAAKFLTWVCEIVKNENEPQKYVWLKIIRFGHWQMQEHICGTLSNEIIISCAADVPLYLVTPSEMHPIRCEITGLPVQALMCWSLRTNLFLHSWSMTTAYTNRTCIHKYSYCSCGCAILWLRRVTITIFVLEVVKLQCKLFQNSGHKQMQINDSK